MGNDFRPRTTPESLQPLKLLLGSNPKGASNPNAPPPLTVALPNRLPSQLNRSTKQGRTSTYLALAKSESTNRSTKVGREPLTYLALAKFGVLRGWYSPP